MLRVLILLGSVLDFTIALCLPRDKLCEFSLIVEEKLVMQTKNGLLIPHEGEVYPYNDKNFTSPFSGDYVQADGYWDNTRMVMTVNGAMPGPAIKVYKGQTVLVHVTNHFESEILSIHWHGIHQSGTPFMDGVPFVSQCPILPGQTFDYKFVAYPPGTHWYHSHSGAQRTNGVHGAFIVYENEPEVAEHIVILSDWVHDYESMTGHLKMNYGLFNGATKYSPTTSLDGAHFSMLQFQSGLINGKGRHWSNATWNNQAPLTVFNVTAGATYRFRVVAAGGLYPFRVSVDGHLLNVVATDGFPLVNKIVQSFIINPGERLDFLLNASATPDNYWFRAESLEDGLSSPHLAEAVLHYQGVIFNTSYSKIVTSQPTNCSRTGCAVLNCPFSYYPHAENTTCLHYSDLESAQKDDSTAPDGEYKDIFLNFAFPGLDSMPGSVNGRSFRNPTSPASVNRNGFVDCAKEECGLNKTCKCSYTIDLDYGKIYQMIFLNMGNGKGWGHPVHLHGHSFYVVKTGYGIYNNITGKIVSDNQDIDCHDYFCNSASWRNASWEDNGVPGVRLTKAVQKDTIIVPSGGYVVTRIKADNPGVWFMHCHIDMHHMDGMAMMIDSGADRRPPNPGGFPECNTYTATRDSLSQEIINSGNALKVEAVLMSLALAASVLL